MSKLRVFFVEIEGGDATVESAMRTVQTLLDEQLEREIIGAAPVELAPAPGPQAKPQERAAQAGLPDDAGDTGRDFALPPAAAPTPPRKGKATRPRKQSTDRPRNNTDTRQVICLEKPGEILTFDQAVEGDW